jgi:hypothetical protein
MRTKKIKNRLNLLIQQACIKKDDSDLKEKIVKELIEDCNIIRRTAQRWINNTHQPSTADVVQIIEVLNRHDNSITMQDFFAKPANRPIPKKLKLVR